MIFTERTITIRNDSSTMNAPVILYRGDKNVEVRFTLVESPYKYSNRDSINVIESTDASYAQLVIKTPNDRNPIFGDITAVGQSNVIFMIGYDMIDEIEEVGTYDFQIRLFDADQTSMATIPEVTGGFIIKEPIAKEDTTNNITNSAIVGSAVVTSDVSIPTFVGGSYNKTAWYNGTVISRQKLDKIEDGIYETYELSKDNSSQIKEIEKYYAKKEDVGEVSQDQVDNWLNNHPEATTTVQDRSITPGKTTFIRVGKNLFNKDDPNNEQGFILGTNGTVVTGTANCITDYILCNPGEQYVKNYGGEVAFYTRDKTFVSMISNNEAVANYSWIIPDTVYYMRVNFRINGTQFNNAQLELGTTPTEYESFKYILEQDYLPIKDIINSSEYKSFHKLDMVEQFYSINEYYKDIQLMKYGAVTHNINDESLAINKSKSSLSLFNRFNEYGYAYINKKKTDAVDIPINVSVQDYNETDFIYFYIIYKCNTANIIPKLTITPFNLLSPTIYDFYNDYKIAEFILQKDATTLLNKLNFSVGTATEQNVIFSFLAPYGFITSQEIKGLLAYKDKILSIKNSPYNKYEGLKYVSIGDSITEQGLYQKFVTEELNLSHFVNRGIGGCTLHDNTNTVQVPVINRYQTDIDADADIITLYAGCNDFGQNGTIDNLDNPYDPKTVCGALRTIIEWVYANFPDKVFIVMNLIPNYYPGREPYGYKNSAGNTIKEYSDAITKVCEEYSVPVADLFSNCYIGENNHTTMLQDGVHPTEAGHKRIANILISKLKSI